MWTIGTDTGGTFTDLVAIDEGGTIRVAKAPSTPPNFEQGVVAALDESGIGRDEMGLLYHGTTVSTNALITRTGARTGLISTEGFRDVIEIRDGSRAEMYDVLWDPPEPLVPRFDRLEVGERVDYAGNVVRPLSEEDVRRAARILRARGAEAIAVCLLHSYANPAHEERIVELLREELPDAYVSASSQVLPEPPEFPRASTTAANAYVGPVLQRYVERLEASISGPDSDNRLVIMHSGGGTMTPDNAVQVPIRTAASGPAAGVLAAAAIATASGRQNVISLDMGGTSADIATIIDGQPGLRTEHDLEWGMPIGFPSIDLIAIGAGGGSIAWIDDAGVPHSGPQSAGADPGPACYGRGGTEPTNTDANLLLGRLRSGTLLGGQLELDLDLARESIESRFARPLGLDAHEAADGILRLSNQHMANGIHQVTVERGLDPREFGLVAFGGAGPMHAAELARELQIPEVIVPPHPGATSALGLLFADARHDFLRAMIAGEDRIDVAAAEALFKEMEDEAVALLRSEGFTDDRIGLERHIDFRYVGQVRALSVPVPSDRLTDALVAKAVSDFHDAYELEYKYAIRELPIESKSLRITATGRAHKPAFAAEPTSPGTADAALGEFDCYFQDAGGMVATPFYGREQLGIGTTLSGPAIIEQYDSTTVVPPDTTVEVDPFRNLIIKAAT